MSVAGPSDKICTIVRAIEANYVEMSESYSSPGTVQTLLWAPCDPNHCGADQRLPLSQAIRSGDDRAIEQLLKAKANPILAEQGQEAPLSLAVRTGSLDYVRLLLHYRAPMGLTICQFNPATPESHCSLGSSSVGKSGLLALSELRKFPMSSIGPDYTLTMRPRVRVWTIRDGRRYLFRSDQSRLRCCCPMASSRDFLCLMSGLLKDPTTTHNVQRSP